MNGSMRPGGGTGGAGAAVCAQTGRERRGAQRLGLRLAVAFREVPARPPMIRHGQTLDVSRSGLRFRAADFLPSGTFIALELDLPGRPAYSARGRAVWSRQTRGNGHWEVGAEFLRAGADADAALAETLAFSA